MRRGTTIALGLLAVAAPIVAWRVLLSSPAGDGSGSGGTPTPVVQTLPRAAGTSGAPRAVSAAGDVLAAVFDDGGLVVRRGGAAVRTAPPEGEEFRRAAALPDGRVVALSQRGRLYVVANGAATALSARAQVGSRLVAQPGAEAVWIAGEAGQLRRLDVGTGAIADVGEGGDAPTSALASTASKAFVGRVDGVVRSGALGVPPADVLTLPTGITALDAAGPWIVAGNAEGDVRSRRPKTKPSGASARVAGRVVALALPRASDAAEPRYEPLLVVHEPAGATVLSSGSYERVATVALAAKPLCGCPLQDSHALYVGLENGDEAIVRVISR